jgi:hypothetical protein
MKVRDTISYYSLLTSVSQKEKEKKDNIGIGNKNILCWNKRIFFHGIDME